MISLRFLVAESRGQSSAERGSKREREEGALTESEQYHTPKP